MKTASSLITTGYVFSFDTNASWFWSEQYDHVLQVAGLLSPDTEFVEQPYSGSDHVTFDINKNGSLGYVCGSAPEN